MVKEFNNKNNRDGRGDSRGKRDSRKEAPEFQQKIIDLARVTRVMAGGKRMRFRACVAIGDGKGRVGVGLAKGADVTVAVAKAVTKAEKNLIKVNFVNETIAHTVLVKNKAAKVLLKPAKKGTGIIAGSAVRVILELCGVPNIVTKTLGSKNKINNVGAVLAALSQLDSEVVIGKLKAMAESRVKNNEKN